MRTPLLFALLLTSLGCAKVDSRYAVASEFGPYVDEFYAQAEARGVFLERDNLVVEFGFTKPGKVGNCKRYEVRDVWGWRYVYQRTASFEKAYWDIINETDRLTLVAHELGHCLLDLEHTKDWCSIMNADNHGICNRPIDEAWDELFGKEML